MAGETLAFVLLTLTNWLTALAFLGLTGAVAGRLIVLPLAERRGTWPGPVRRVLAARFRGSAMVSAAVLIVAAVGRLYAQTYSVFGLDERITGELLRVVALDSRWGARWLPQLGGGTLAVLAVGSIWWRPTGGWRVSVLAVGVLAVALPLTGHAMAYPGGVAVPWTLQTTHVVAAGLWLGTLAALVVAFGGLPKSEMETDRRLAALVCAFSPLAVGAVVLLTTTGVWISWLYLDRWADLWRTAWGRTLLLKLVLMLATGVLGAYNWLRLKPLLGVPESSARLRRTTRVELALGGLVLMVTAVLVHRPLPHE